MSQHTVDGRVQTKGLNSSYMLSNNSQKGFSTLSMGLVVIIIALVVSAGYVYQKNQKEIAMLNQVLHKVENNLSLKEHAVDEFKSELAKVAADVKTQDAIFNDHLKALEANLDKVGLKVNKLAMNSSQEWLLSEIEYLMKMADNRILMKEDVKGAIALLKSAEKVIAKMPVADSGLNAVRTAISRDIAAMELYRGIDVPGTYSELVALSSIIDKLPMIPLEADNVNAPEDDAVAENTSQGDSLVDKINSSMGEYLIIRRYSVDELEQMLTEDQRATLKNTMRLQLEQAQTAILRGEQSIYDASLQKVRTSLLNYFQSDDYRVGLAKMKLDKLIDVEIETQLPDIASAQQELKRYLSDRMRSGTL